MPPSRSSVALLTSAAIATLLVAACSSSASAQDNRRAVRAKATYGNWTAYHGSRARTGVATTMPAVHGTMHVTFRLRLDGAVYASPIVIGRVTYVATENDTVYAFGPSYRQLWRRHLGTPSPAGERPCGNIDPLGITGTPVYDASTNSIYVAPEYSGSPPRHELVSLNAATGAVRWHKSIDLPGVDPAAMQERGALTLAGVRVWVPFGGLAGDCGAYKGRVVGLTRTSGSLPLSYTVPTTREAGIWTPPGPTVATDRTMFVAVGNGESGVGDPYDHSDSVLHLSTGAKLLDSFSPTTWPTDNDADLDLGSQGPAIVGNWVFIAGKSGTAYVLRRSHLGGIGGQVSKSSVCRSFGGTAVSGSVVYVPCTDGVRAVRIDSAGTMHVLWHASTSITGAPVIGGGRVWALDTGAGVLHALDPGTGSSRAHVTVGSVSRFATPALYGPNIRVPTLAGLAVVTTS